MGEAGDDGKCRDELQLDWFEYDSSEPAVVFCELDPGHDEDHQATVTGWVRGGRGGVTVVLRWPAAE